jgi:hypothetical protein
MNPKLDRKLSLLHATAINMIDMVGIGPFVVLSVVAQIMGGPYFYTLGLQARFYPM